MLQTRRAGQAEQGRDRQWRTPLTLGGRPLLAVVMPVYAPTDAHLVRMLVALDRLSRQARQPDYLVLVDDGSPLAIPSIIRCGRYPVPRLLLHGGPCRLAVLYGAAWSSIESSWLLKAGRE